MGTFERWYIVLQKAEVAGGNPNHQNQVTMSMYYNPVMSMSQNHQPPPHQQLPLPPRAQKALTITVRTSTLIVFFWNWLLFDITFCESCFDVG